MLALVAFGISPIDSDKIILEKITKKLAWINDHVHTLNEAYILLIDQYIQELKSRNTFDDFFATRATKFTYIKVANQNKNFFKINPEQFYILALLFQKKILTEHDFLSLACHAHFHYENLDYYEEQKISSYWFRYPGFCELLFTVPSTQHLAVVTVMRVTAIAELLRDDYLSIKDICQFVLSIEQQANESMPNYVHRVTKPFYKWRPEELSPLDWKIVTVFFHDSRLKQRSDTLELFMLATHHAAMPFYQNKLFSIKEFLNFVFSHRYNTDFIYKKLRLLQQIAKNSSFLPVELQSKPNLRMVWEQPDYLIARYIRQVKFNKTRHRLAKYYDISLDTLKKYEDENSLNIFTAFMDLKEEVYLENFFLLSDINLEDVLNTRTVQDLHAFTTMLSHPQISYYYITGKLCPEFLLHIEPIYLLNNSRLEFFLSFPQLMQKQYIESIVKTVQRHPDVLAAETPEQKGQVSRLLFSLTLYQNLNQAFFYEVKNLILIAKNQGIFVSSNKKSEPQSDKPIPRSMSYSYGATD